MVKQVIKHSAPGPGAGKKERPAQFSTAVCGECRRLITEDDREVWFGSYRVHAACGEEAWKREWKIKEPDQR